MSADISMEVNVTPWWWGSAEERGAVAAAIAAVMDAHRVYEVRATRRALFASVELPRQLSCAIALLLSELTKVAERAGEPLLRRDGYWWQRGIETGRIQEVG